MTALKKTKKPRKPSLAKPWKHYGPRLVDQAGITLRIYPTDDVSLIGNSVIIGYPSEMRKLAKKLIEWADWAESKVKK